MNRIIFETQLPEYRLDPRDPRLEHVRGVLRMGVGDRFDVGVANGPAGKATILALDEAGLRVAVEWGAVPPPPPPVRLLVGMCRPATARKILSTAPTLGVQAIHFAATARSDPAYARASLWHDGEWRARLIEGIEQAFDTWLPEVRVHESLAAACAAIPADCQRLALDVYEGGRPLGACALAPGVPVCLAVGPERGWDARDRADLRAGGFELVSLGRRVMRVEIAVTAGLALVLAGIGAL